MTPDIDTTDLLERARALGVARLDALTPGMRASAELAPWAPAADGPAFSIGDCWTQCTFYAVDDYEAELGFYLDILGLKTFTINDVSSMVTSPKNEFFIGVNRADDDQPATNPSSLRIQFMVDRIEEVVAELERRGIAFDVRPAPESEGSPMWFGTMRSPNGVRVDLWGMVA
jgi:predicted enzyme related to lactoylglutathione lyase